EPDDPGRLVSGDTDGKGQPIANRFCSGRGSRRAVHEADLLIEATQRGIAETGRAAANAQLDQAGAGPHQNAEGERRYLGKERPLVAFADAVEFYAVVG